MSEYLKSDFLNIHEIIRKKNTADSQQLENFIFGRFFAVILGY